MFQEMHWYQREGYHNSQLSEQNIIVIDSEHHNNIREQVGRGPHVPLAIQVAIAVVTPVETSYPLTQV